MVAGEVGMAAAVSWVVDAAEEEVEKMAMVVAGLVVDSEAATAAVADQESWTCQAAAAAGASCQRDQQPQQGVSFLRFLDIVS